MGSQGAQPRRALKRELLVALAVLLVVQMVLLPAGASPAQTEVTGTVTVKRGISQSGRPMPEQVRLREADGTTWELPADRSTVALDRQEATVRGVASGRRITPSSVTRLATGSGGSHSPGLPGPKTGSQQWATLLCKFNDVAAEPENLAFFQTLIGDQGGDPAFPSMDHFWRENSYEKLNLEGSVESDWRTLPGTQASYREVNGDGDTVPKFNLLAQDCADLHDGVVDFNGVDGINLMINGSIDTCCAWGGGETITVDEGGSTSFDMTWMPPFGYRNHDVLGQEMGHGFGLPHSSGPYDATYDSQWDVMSGGGTCGTTDPDYGCIGVHTVSPYKDALGWIDNDERFVWNGTDSNVKVHLTRLALPQFNPNPAGETPYLMAKLPIPGGNDFYTVEVRKFAGYDVGVPGEAVLIHKVDPDPDDSNARVVDATDDDDPNDDGAMWLVGETYEDEANDIAIQVLDATTSGFVIVINPVTVADLSVTKTATPDPAVAGDLLRYNVTVRNNGPGTAEDVVLTDTLPAGVTYLADTGGCSRALQVLTCNIGQLEAGQSKVVSVLVEVDDDLVALAGGPTTVTNTAAVAMNEEIEDPDLSNNTATLVTFVVDRADLRAHKDCKPDRQIDAGETATCTITIHNLGPSVARNTVVVDRIVSDGTFTVSSATSTPGGPCNIAGSPGSSVTVTCTMGALPVGTAAGSAVVRVTATEKMDINDEATVSSASPDPNPGDNYATDTVQVRAVSDLAVAKSGGPDPVTAGETLTYMVAVTNSGPSTAEAVVLTDAVPAGVSVVSVVPTVGTCTAGKPGVASAPTRCTVGNLAPGGAAAVTITLRVLPATRGILVNDATVSALSHDPNTANNSANLPIEVVGEANLSLAKTASPNPVAAGATLSYELVATNNGPSTAENVVIADELDSRVTFTSASVLSPGGSCVLVVGGATTPGFTDLVRCSISSALAPGATAEVHIDVVVDPDVAFGQTIQNRATATSSTPGTPAIATASTNVVTLADLALAMDSNFETGNASTTIIYTITVTNNGPSDAQAVTVQQNLPSEKTKSGQEKVVFVFATEGCAYSAATSPHSVTCTLGTMKSGDSVTSQVHVQVKGTTGPLSSTATVTSTTADPVAANNTDTELVTVSGGSDRPGGPGGGRGKT